jgi:toxin YoeB
MNYEIVFSKLVLEQIAEFKKSEIPAYKKVMKLLGELMEHPYSGTGKPELMKHDFSGQWSRRISRKHRLVYSIDDETVTIYVITIKGHYDDK